MGHPLAWGISIAPQPAAAGISMAGRWPAILSGPESW
jgi:hypothetical protein